MKPEAFKDILFEPDDKGLVTVTLNTPKRKNALSPYTFYELYWAIDILEKSSDLKAMILTGAKDEAIDDSGKEAFSSGGYFNESALKDIDEEAMKEIDFSDLAQKKLVMKMFQCYKPIVAAINGLAIGAGFTMPLAGADLIYLSEHAWIQLPFARLGLVSELACTFLLPRLVGFQKAKEIIYFSQKLSAQEALDLNLVNGVFPHEELLPAVREITSKIIPPKGASFALETIKKNMHRPFIQELSNMLDDENKGLQECMKSEDFGEGLMARIEKREAVFKGC